MSDRQSYADPLRPCSLAFVMFDPPDCKGVRLSRLNTTSRMSARHRLLLRAAIPLLIVSLAACSSAGPDVRQEALAYARVTIDKVSALAVESAIGLDLDGYAVAVARGEVWPKPVFGAVREDSGEPLPSWAHGVSFDVETDQSGNYPKVMVSYAVPGQGSAGSGFNARIANVLVCVGIAIEFVNDEVDVYMPPIVTEVTCPTDVRRYFGGDEVVTLEEVLATG